MYGQFNLSLLNLCVSFPEVRMSWADHITNIRQAGTRVDLGWRFVKWVLFFSLCLTPGWSCVTLFELCLLSWTRNLHIKWSHFDVFIFYNFLFSFSFLFSFFFHLAQPFFLIFLLVGSLLKVPFSLGFFLLLLWNLGGEATDINIPCCMALSKVGWLSIC